MNSARRFAPAVGSVVLAIVVSLTWACSKSDTPTSPDAAGMTGTVSGNVVAGTSGARAPLGVASGLSGVTVRAGAGGPATQTNANGDFVLQKVPSGSVELQFERSDIHARGNVSVPAGTTLTVTVSIVGASALIVGGGHAGEEIEGLVLSVDAGAKTFKVQDQRLGTVQIRVTDTTVIRHGQTTVALADLAVGWRVHVKAMLGSDGVYLATEVIVQDESSGGGDPTTATANGHIESIDAGAKSFVVLQANGGHKTVKTDDSTTFKKHGNAVTFGDLAVGDQVECQGAPQSDGSILARQVVVQ